VDRRLMVPSLQATVRHYPLGAGTTLNRLDDSERVLPPSQVPRGKLHLPKYPQARDQMSIPASVNATKHRVHRVHPSDDHPPSG
jgi:hypothetical protein